MIGGLKKSQFVLRTADIPNLDNLGVKKPVYTDAGGGVLLPTRRTIAFENALYSINIYQSQMTFKQINMREILKNIFENGGNYILKLNAISFGLGYNSSYGATNENDRIFNVWIYGLPFVSSFSYGSTLNRALLCTVRIPNGSTLNTYTFNTHEVLFQLNKDNLVEMRNITIEYRDVESNTLEPTNTANVVYPNATFNFSIYKVD